MKLCESCGACFDDGYDLCGFDGGALVPLFAGSRVVGGRYLLEQRVAAGAMGVVVRATHLQVGSTVAVKLMRPEKDDTHVALARFQREAQILGQIKHPNAVLVIDFGIEQRDSESQPYLVMEYLRGESLHALLDKKGRLTLEELERILVPLCDAVEEAHAVGVIHRDIKPSNVVLEKLRDGSEIVKVLDFGIAKFVARGKRAPLPPGASAGGFAPAPITMGASTGTLEGDVIDELADLLADDDDDDEPAQFLAEVVSTRAAAQDRTVEARKRAGSSSTPPSAPRDPTTEAGFMIGTVPYMAPEQMTGSKVSVRTDVHAVAVLAFQCLAGRLPFDGDDEDIIAQKLSDDRPSLADMGVDVPPEIDAILQRSFALDPEERPATVREIGDVVRAALHAAMRSARGNDHDDDAVAHALVQLGAIGKALATAESAARAWVSASAGAGGEEHYNKARDVLLALDAPLGRVKSALDAADAPIEREMKHALVDAKRALAEHVNAVRRSLARLDQDESAASEYGDYLAALWTRLDVAAQEIIDLLTALSDDDTTAETGPLLPVQLFAEVESVQRMSVGDLADRLLARDPLDAADALELVLAEAVDQVVQALGPGRDDALATRLVRGLWRHADTILLHELSPLRRTFRLLPFLANQRDLVAAAPFSLLARLLGARTLAESDVVLALSQLERPEDRSVLARCLLVHPSLAARTHAMASLELSELWSVIAHPSTPIAVLDFAFEHVRTRARNEYLKIFFFCVRDTLRAAASSADVTDAFRLIRHFFQVPCFHEDIVFEPLLDLDRALHKRDPASLDDGYADALATFTADGAHEAKPLESMRDVPLPIQRKLA
ncbi:MAG TPA: serine/threonine-protein kinase, partial [Myxococcota bacterium]